MTGLWFSGTGNSRHCVEEFTRLAGGTGRCMSIMTPRLSELLEEEETLVLGYPTCFSNVPMAVRDFIEEGGEFWRGRKVFVIATMGLFSGDGAGCAARLLHRHGAVITGGLHLKMPDSVGDNKLLKRPPEVNMEIVRRADEKIAWAAKRLCEGRPTHNGLSFWHRVAGAVCQRLWFRAEATSYKDKPDIDRAKCTVCGICVKHCPMGNLEKVDGTIVHGRRCTMCYSCVDRCPAQAVTILGRRVWQQPLFGKYM